MADLDDFEENLKPKRSTLLTVLCILSFVGSAWGILSSATSFMMYSSGTMQKVQENQAKTLQRLKEDKSTKNAFALKMMEGSAVMMDPEKVKLSTLFQFVASILTLTGAIIMFRQNVIGYGIYIIGCLLAIGATLYIFGANNFLTTIGVSFTGFFSIIFIALYGMCVKEMRQQKIIA